MKMIKLRDTNKRKNDDNAEQHKQTFSDCFLNLHCNSPNPHIICRAIIAYLSRLSCKKDFTKATVRAAAFVIACAAVKCKRFNGAER